jgi:hypothetical protein
MDISQDSETAAWVNNFPQLEMTRQALCKASETKKNTKPTEDNFYVPSNQVEYKAMVKRLVDAEFLPNEAEQIICNRRTA